VEDLQTNISTNGEGSVATHASENMLEIGGLLNQAPQGGEVVDHLFGLDVHPHWRSVDFLVLAGVAMVELRFRAPVIGISVPD
jgi:hypothetical protein